MPAACMAARIRSGCGKNAPTSAQTTGQITRRPRPRAVSSDRNDAGPYEGSPVTTSRSTELSIAVTTGTLSFFPVQVGPPAGAARLLEAGVDVDPLADQADELAERVHRAPAPDDQRAFPLLEMELLAGFESQTVAQRFRNRHLTLFGEP